MSDFEKDIDWNDWIGRRVCIKDTMFGTLKYFGQTNFCSGLWCGVALDNQLGKNNGTVNNVKYFSCEPNFGIFVPPCKVTKIKETVLVKDEDITNIKNETFEIQSNCTNVSVIENLKSAPVCDNWINEACEVSKKKLLDSRLDSEESLGILSLDLIEDNDIFDETLLEMSFGNNVQNYENLTDSPLNTFDDVFPEVINGPQYASTPRHTATKKFADFDCAIKYNLSIIHEDNENYFRESQNDSEIFDYKKFNPNLTSTTKNMECVIKDNLTLTNGLLNSDLNKTQTLPCSKLINEGIDCLNVTFKLAETPSGLFLNESKNVTVDDKKLNSTINLDQIKKNENADDCLKENIHQTNNPNTTFELKYVENTLQELSTNICKNTVNLKMNETIDLSSNAYDLNTNNKDKMIKINEYDIHLKENLYQQTSNLNSTFELNCVDNASHKLPTNMCKNTINLGMNETVIHSSNTSDLNLNKILENTFAIESSPVKELGDDLKKNTSHILRDINLKESPKFNSIRRSIGDFSNKSKLNCKEFPLVNKRDSIVSKAVIKSDSCNLHKEEFKKPFIPSTLHSSKQLKKPTSMISLECEKSINSKVNLNSRKSISVSRIDSISKDSTKSVFSQDKYRRNSISALNSISKNDKLSTGTFGMQKNKLVSSKEIAKNSSFQPKLVSKPLPANKIENAFKNLKSLENTAHHVKKLNEKSSIDKNSDKLQKSKIEIPKYSANANKALKPHLEMPKYSANANKALKPHQEIPKFNTDRKIETIRMSNLVKTIEPRVPKRNSLVVPSKDKVPISIINRRHSIVPPKVTSENEKNHLPIAATSSLPVAFKKPLPATSKQNMPALKDCTATSKEHKSISLRQTIPVPKRSLNENSIKSGLKPPGTKPKTCN